MSSTTCPSCGGEGRCWYEVQYAAPMAWRGGWLEKEMECHLCEDQARLTRRSPRVTIPDIPPTGPASAGSFFISS